MVQQIPPAFFSYSRQDSDFALRLAKDLKASGAAVWLEKVNPWPGSESIWASSPARLFSGQRDCGRVKRKPQLTDLVQVWAARVACTVASGAAALEQTL